MPVPAAASAAGAAISQLATRVAQSETARDIAKTAATSTAERLTQKALQGLDNGRPAARTSDTGTGQTMAPRKHLVVRNAAPESQSQPSDLPPPTYEQSQTGRHGRLTTDADLPPSYEQAMSGRLDGPPNFPAAPPTYSNATSARLDRPFDMPAQVPTAAHKPAAQAQPRHLNPDALPFMKDDGTWVSANDPSNPAHHRPAPAGRQDAPATSARLDRPFEQPADMQHLVSPSRPGPARPQTLNPDALPFMKPDGTWVSAHDPANPAHARPQPRPPVQPPRPTLQTPAAAAAPVSTPVAAARPHALESQPKRSSFRQALRSFFGGSKVSEVKARPEPNTIAMIGGRYNGQPVEIRLSRRDTRAFQQQHGIANRDFDVLQYLAWEKSRQNPMRPANVQVRLGGFDTNLTRLDLNEIEFNQYDANRRAIAG